MSKKDVINYVMNSPYNTNPAVLKSLLEDIQETNKELDLEVVSYTIESGGDALQLTLTWAEIKELFDAGKTILFIESGTYNFSDVVVNVYFGTYEGYNSNEDYYYIVSKRYNFNHSGDSYFHETVWQTDTEDSLPYTS